MATDTRPARPVAALLAAVVALTVLLVAPAADAAPAAPAAPDAPAAVAGEKWCYVTGDLCGRVLNTSSYGVLALKNWGDMGSTSWLSAGSSTPRWEDWDGFRIDAGWCYKFVIYNGPIPWWFTRDLRGVSQHQWYQIHDHQTAEIYFQSTSSC